MLGVGVGRDLRGSSSDARPASHTTAELCQPVQFLSSSLAFISSDMQKDAANATFRNRLDRNNHLDELHLASAYRSMTSAPRFHPCSENAPLLPGPP